MFGRREKCVLMWDMGGWGGVESWSGVSYGVGVPEADRFGRRRNGVGGEDDGGL